MTAATTLGMGLTISRVGINYGSNRVIDDLDLDVRPGEILVVAGKSGCGKSTLLRALAGLRTPDTGVIRADGVPVEKPSADRALVFQDDALLPWRTVRDNIGFALRLRGYSRADSRAKSLRWIDEVGLTGYANHLPRDLSGGMRQRVQLARSLAGSPRAVLMDEPFGALDAQTRSDMQRLLIETWKAHPTTVVFVTHDLDEALRIGDRIAVLGGGRLRAVLDVPEPRQPIDRSHLKAQILEQL